MLITRRGTSLCLVTQPDHARLAGALAEQWGNEQFATPEPRASVLLAASLHDESWRGYDEAPSYDDELGRPRHFLEVPLPESIAFYGTGVDDLYTRDRYAGVLVGMHWAGLYSARWGVQAGPGVEHPAAVEVVAGEERRWSAVARELWGYDGLRSAFEARLWHNYELLQAFDLLSLCLCTVDLSQPTDRAVPSVPVPATLGLIDQPPGGRIVPQAPTAVGGPHTDLAVTVVASGVVEVDPYPFTPSSFEVEVPARLIPDRRYASAQDAADALRKGPTSKLSCRLLPRETAPT